MSAAWPHCAYQSSSKKHKSAEFIAESGSEDGGDGGDGEKEHNKEDAERLERQRYTAMGVLTQMSDSARKKRKRKSCCKRRLPRRSRVCFATVYIGVSVPGVPGCRGM